MRIYAHSSEQRNQVSQLLTEAINQLDDVNARIEALTTQQTILRHRIASYQDALSPIQRLPRDVLQEIFIHCLPTNQNASMDASQSPLLLGRVCSSWHVISRSTPYLWTSLHIAQSVDCPEDRSHYTRIRTAIVEWFYRSGTSLPLSISMTKTLFLGVKSPLAGDRDAELDTVKVVLPFISRCRRLSLDVSPRSMQPVLDLSEDNFAMLETLIIHRKSLMSSGRGGRADFHPWSTIMRAPQIRKVWIHAPYFSSKDLILPMQQLTHLDIHVRLRKQDMGTLLRRLSDCERLVSCTLRVDRESDELEVLAVPVRLERLETLNVFSQSKQDLGPLFSSIRVPRIRYLCCEDAYSHVASRPLSVSSLLSSTSESVKLELELEGLYLQVTPHVEQTVLDILASCTPLKHLKLVMQPQQFNFGCEGCLRPSGFFTQKLLPALTLGEAGQVGEEGQELQCLCPALETLFVEFPVGSRMEKRLQDNLTTFLRSRATIPCVGTESTSTSTRPTPARLKSVIFNVVGMDGGLMENIRDFVLEILEKETCQLSISSASHVSTTKPHDYRPGFDWEEWS